jgi:hypothetical protein
MNPIQPQGGGVFSKNLRQVRRDLAGARVSAGPGLIAQRTAQGTVVTMSGFARRKRVAAGTSGTVRWG